MLSIFGLLCMPVCMAAMHPSHPSLPGCPMQWWWLLLNSLTEACRLHTRFSHAPSRSGFPPYTYSSPPPGQGFLLKQWLTPPPPSLAGFPPYTVSSLPTRASRNRDILRQKYKTYYHIVNFSCLLPPSSRKTTNKGVDMQMGGNPRSTSKLLHQPMPSGQNTCVRTVVQPATAHMHLFP